MSIIYFIGGVAIGTLVTGIVFFKPYAKGFNDGFNDGWEEGYDYGWDRAISAALYKIRNKSGV